MFAIVEISQIIVLLHYTLKTHFKIKQMAISKKTRAKKSASMKKAWAKKKSVQSKGKKKTWTQFMKGKMGPYMKSEGSHKKAMQRLSKEWKAYNK